MESEGNTQIELSIKKQNLTEQTTTATTTGRMRSKTPAKVQKKQMPSLPRRRRIRSELDRLLSDEGTRNMLKGLKKPKNAKPVTGAAAVFRKRAIVGENNNNGEAKRNGKIGVNVNRRGTRERGFRNSGRGRGVMRRAGGGVILPPPPPPVKTSSSNRGRSRSGSPAKTKLDGGKDHGDQDESKIDYRLVNISRRGNVAWITVIGSNGGGGEVKEEKENGDNGKSSRRLDGGFGTKILQSIECAFRTLEHDNSISVIVLQNSHSRYFCNGIDVSELLIPSSRVSEGNSSGSNNNSINGGNGVIKNAFSNQFSGIIRAMKSLITTLNSSRKLLVASITGDCVGFGVMILPLFDLVYANDKSMFKFYYNALGQSPECVGLISGHIKGGAVGKLMNLLYLNTPLTAIEAQLCGLVTEAMWPACYQEELATRIHTISTNSKAMIKSKNIVRNLKPVVRINDLWGEFGTLEGEWASPEFQTNARTYLSCDGVMEDYKGLNGI